MKHRILVLEDDRTSRKLLVHMLEQAGYDVLECSHGKDAIHITMMNPPKVIVADVMLPDINGTQVVNELQALPSCKYLKAVFLTGILSKKNSELSKKFKFLLEGSRYKALAKPVRKSVLLRILAELIAEADAEERADRRETKLAEARARAAVEAKIKARKEAAKQQSEEVDADDSLAVDVDVEAPFTL